MNRRGSVLSLVLVAVLLAGIDVTRSSAQISADTAASQSMRFIALSESGKILQDLQVGDSRAIIVKCAPQLDYDDKQNFETRTSLGEREIFYSMEQSPLYQRGNHPY